MTNSHAWVTMWCSKCGVHQDSRESNEPCAADRFRAEHERDRYRDFLIEALMFIEAHVSVDSPWTREVRQVLGMAAAPSDRSDTPSATASAPDGRDS